MADTSLLYTFDAELAAGVDAPMTAQRSTAQAARCCRRRCWLHPGASQSSWVARSGMCLCSQVQRWHQQMQQGTHAAACRVIRRRSRRSQQQLLDILRFIGVAEQQLAALYLPAKPRAGAWCLAMSSRNAAAAKATAAAAGSHLLPTTSLHLPCCTAHCALACSLSSPGRQRAAPQAHRAAAGEARAAILSHEAQHRVPRHGVPEED